MSKHQDFVLRAENVSHAYYSLPVLERITLFLSAGERIGLVGRSGSGKSTLLNLLGLLMQPQHGRIFLRAKKGFVDIQSLSPQQLAYLRRVHIGFVFQSHRLLPEFTALENVVLPQRFNGKSLKESRNYATSLLEYVGLSDRIHHKPSELSGGEQQRVAIARALANKPSVLLTDEPTGNLDVETAKIIMQLFYHITQNHGVTLLMATHNLESLQEFNRVYALEMGVLVPVKRPTNGHDIISTEAVSSRMQGGRGCAFESII